MENKTKIKIPVKYQHMIELIEKDAEGYWAYSRSGFYFDGMGCHTAREDNQKELIAMIKTLKPCSCEQCEGAAK